MTRGEGPPIIAPCFTRSTRVDLNHAHRGDRPTAASSVGVHLDIEVHIETAGNTHMQGVILATCTDSHGSN